MPAKNQTPKKEAHPTFESAIERLESIVEQMESNKLPLEDLLVRYEEGIHLVKFCSEKLAAAEKRIEIITREAGGKARAVEFESGEKPDQNAVEENDVRLF
jgi:exodeoxyribonuclease VII small subunit